MNSEYLEISNIELMKMIDNDVEFRNAVATAHGVREKNGNEFKGTCSYPQRYKVNETMIIFAKNKRYRDTKIMLEEQKNNLLFVGMGWHKATTDGDVKNCRIRTILRNKQGLHIFLALTAAKAPMSKDNKQYIYCNSCSTGNGNQNYLDLEKITYNLRLEWNLKNILDFVNKYLYCDFKNIYIDNFNLSGDLDDAICFTPVK